MKIQNFLVNLFILFVCPLLLVACGQEEPPALAIPEGVILDVRTSQEFNTGHIPDAILLPYDQLYAEVEELIPDKDQTIFVYCQSGRRSRIAASLLREIGYSSVYDLGGIINWDGEVIVP